MSDRLSCSGLRASIGSHVVLSNLTISLDAGRVTIVVGPNGAGKSTLLACLAGLRTPTAGVVDLGGADLARMRPGHRAQRIALLPQTPEIAWPVEARALIELGRTPFLGARGPSEVDRASVDRAVASANVADLQHRVVGTLSGGERGRVLIARALAGDPEWLLADEPLTGLDPAHQLDAADLFRRLADEGVGVVMTLHDLSLAARLADRVIVLAGGAIAADGPPLDALTPDVLRQTYGVEAIVSPGPAGAVIDIVRRG